MLQDLRKHSQSWVVYLLFAIIILVFVFMFGLPSTESCNPKTNLVVAKVGDHIIHESDLRSAVLRNYSETLRTNSDYKIFQETALKNMMTVYMLADKAIEKGLRVNDDELKDYITNWERDNPDIMNFMRNGKFDRNKYEQFLAYTGISTDKYEEYKRYELLAKNYLSLLESTIVTSQFESELQYERSANMANIEYLRLQHASVLPLIAKLTNTEIDNYLKTNNADIEKYYQDNINKYTTPETLKLQEVVIQKDPAMLKEAGSKTNKSLSPEQRFAVAQKQILEDKIDFTQAFNEYDESLLKKEDGIQVDIKVENLSKEYRDALKDKNINDVFTVETNNRYIFVKLLERKEKYVKPIDELKKEIAQNIITTQRLNEKIEQIANSILAEIKDGKSMDNAIQKVLYADVLEEAPEPQLIPDPDNPEQQIEVPVQTDKIIIPLVDRVSKNESGFFNMYTTYIPKIGDLPDLTRDLENLTPGTVLPQVYTLNNDKIIAVFKEKDKLDKELFKTQQELLNQQKVFAILGNWRAIFNPQRAGQLPQIPTLGPWIQAQFDAASADGIFRQNQKFFEQKNVQNQ